MAGRFSVLIVLAILVGSLVMQATAPAFEDTEPVFDEPQSPIGVYPLPTDGELPEPPEFTPLGPLPTVRQTLKERIKEQIPEDDFVGEVIHDLVQTGHSVTDRLPTEQDLGLAPLPGPRSRSENASVAEQLLKSARLLENMNPTDSQRVDLVEQLRVEAERLLSE